MPLARVALASGADVDRAVEAARTAYEKVWSKTSGAQRAKYLFRIARLIQERSRELAVVETLDNGKPIRESRDVDIPLAAAHFFYYAGWADKLDFAGFGPNPRPLGVAGQIIPWNFPLLMAAWKLAPALAAGNTCVLKPAETTPLSALLLAEILQQAELPPGVVNIITGDGTSGAALVDHPGVDKIAFTGSTEVGRLSRTVASSRKHLTLELGGKGANIVFDDAPIDEMIEGIIDGIFFNQGHVCCAGSRLLVQETVADEVLRRLIRRVDQLRVAIPSTRTPTSGPSTRPRNWPESKNSPTTGERRAPRDTPVRACCPKGLLVRADRLRRRRPVAPHRPRRDLRPGPVGADLPHARRSGGQGQQHELRPGVRRVERKGQSHACGSPNGCGPGSSGPTPITGSIPTSPFGGVRESGFGREGGRHGLEAYLDV